DALEQEEQLRLEREARSIDVEVLQERVVVRPLEQQLGAERRRQQRRQRALAGTDRPFDGDVPVTPHVTRGRRNTPRPAGTARPTGSRASVVGACATRRTARTRSA